MTKAKEIVGFDCAGSAADGIKIVLSVRVEEMCELRASALDWTDIEGVHHLRVASRRLRSALRDCEPYLGKGLQQKRLKDIASALGAVRDDDVAIATLEELKTVAEAEVSAGIDRLLDERRWRRESARTVLEKAISESSFASLQEKFTTRLERKIKSSDQNKRGRDGRDDEEMTFRHFGSETILVRLAELLEGGESLYQPWKVKPLHRLRIAAKRLRYAIELFGPCWGEQLTPFAEEVAELQTTLGDLHDYDVWIDDLGARLRNQPQDGAPKGATAEENEVRESVAAVWLLKHFTKERTKQFNKSLARWQTWKISDFPGRLALALEPAPTAYLPPLSLTADEAVITNLAM